MVKSRQSWKVLESKELFAVRPYVVVSRERVRTDTGVEVDDFFRVDLAPFSVCVPQLPDGGIITLWQYKHGPRAYGLSFPAGYLDEGEDPLAACGRELKEETGLEAGTWHHLGQFVDNGNQRGCIGNYFVATNCHFIAEPRHGDLENMELRVMRPQEIDLALAAGDIQIIHHVAAWCLARPYLIGE